MYLHVGIALSYGQQATIGGRTVDTTNHHFVPRASVTLLRPDSMLVSFTRSAVDGNFLLQHIPSGDFLLLITDPQFGELWMALKVTGDTSINLGSISLPPRSSTLEAAIVTQYRSIVRLKGDTVEYDVANVKTKINASVEDLLKQLPGLEVDQKGVITAQGEKIQKVFVEGEEFFSDDPTIVTRNLKADMVDKVQVLNKKSPQAEFTGVDDGKTTKALNLTLREDKKHGWFGKVEVGADISQYYNGNAFAGAFKTNRKFSVFGMASNTGQSSLVGEDAQNFDDGNNVLIPEVPEGGDNFGISGAIGGVPQTKNAGVHYSNKWNGDGLNSGQHFSANYRYNSNFNNASTYSFTQQTLPDSIYAQTQLTSSLSSKEQHSLSGIYDLALDSSSSLRLGFLGITDTGHNQDVFIDTTLLNNTLVNSNRRSSDAHIDNNRMISNILWRKKFSRPGQTLSTEASFQSSDQHVYGFLYSRDEYYQSVDSALSADTTDQKKDNRIHTNTLEGNMLYTSPLGKSCVLAATYGVAITHNQSLRSTWNRGNGKYDDYVDSLSSQYAFNIATQQLKLTAKAKLPHLTCTFGGDISYSAYRQTDLQQDTSLRYHYLNVFPYFLAFYKISPFQTFSLYYYGSTQQPSIYQLQPTKNNNDPLNIVLGNPGLQPAFTHSFTARMTNFKLVTGRSFYAEIDFSFITNDITSRSFIDSLGRTVTESVNTNGTENLALSGAYIWQLHSLNLHLELNAKLPYARAVNFVNNLQNFTDDYTPTAGFSIGRNIPDKYYFKINPTFGYTYSLSSINPTASTHFWNETYTAECGYTFPAQLDFSTNAIYTWRQKINPADKMNESLLWNASLDKRFAKNALTAKFAVNDILDQNKGFSSSITANEIVQTTSTAIRRYWMLSLIWNFSNHAHP